MPLAKGPRDTSNLKTIMPKDAELKSVKIRTTALF